MSYKSTVLQVIRRHADPLFYMKAGRALRRHREFPRWTVEWTFKLLIEPAWADLRAKGVQAAIDVLTTAKDSIPSLARDVGFDMALVPLTATMLCGVEPESLHGDLAHTEVAVFRVGYEKTPPELKYQDWNEKVWAALEKAPGIFQLFNRSFRLARDRTPSELSALAESIRDIAEMPYLNSSVAEYLPNALLSSCHKIEKDQIDRFFENGEFRSVRSIMPQHRSSQKPAHGHLSRLQGFAVNLLGRPSFAHDYVTYLQTREGSAELLDFCESDPHMLLHQVGLWGTLFSLNDTLRTTVLAAAQTDQWRVDVHTFRPPAINAFELRLPAEVTLIPYIVRLLTSVAFSRYQEESFAYGDIGRDREKTVTEAIRTYVPLAESLLGVIQDSKLPTYIRAAGAILYLRHPNACIESRSVCRDELVSLYTAKSGFWLLPASAFAFNDEFAKGERPAVEAISALLESARTDLEARFNIEPMLKSWREISRAPVQASRDTSLWQ